MISHMRTNIFGYIMRTVHSGIAAGVMVPDGPGTAFASLALRHARVVIGDAIEERMRTGRPLDGEPAYLFGASGIDPRAQGFGDDLSAEANSKHGLVRRYGLANQRDLWTKPAETSLVIRTHRAAHDSQHVEIGKRRQRGIAVQVE